MGLLFKNHVDHYFIVFEHIQQSFLRRRSGRLSKHYQYFWGRCSFYEIFDIFQYQQRMGLISIEYPKKWSQILLNCARLQFDFCLTKMYDFQKRTIFLQNWISNLQDLLRSQSPWQSAFFCSITTWQYWLYSLVWWIYEINRFKRLSKFWPISLWIVSAYLLFIKCQVVQFLPSLNISEQFESMYLTIFQQI